MDQKKQGKKDAASGPNVTKGAPKCTKSKMCGWTKRPKAEKGPR